MQYLEFEIPCTGEMADILMAELSQVGFDSFLQEDTYIKGYIANDVFNPEELKQVVAYYNISTDTIQQSLLENKNWNEAWEKNYKPIIIADKCYVRAGFHEPKPQYPYEIVIQPKMSFGTGHHATTAQMMELMLTKDLRGKKVLDMGCGTGVLSVLAYKMGAAKVTAVDNEEWAYKNTLENFYINKVMSADVVLGEIEDVENEEAEAVNLYDIVLSNITKNINIQYLPHYAQLLQQNGRLIVSGFLDTDLKDIEANAINFGFRMLSSSNKNNWSAAIFTYDGKK